MNSLISTPERTKNLKRFEGKPRRCARCGTRLSRYNDNRFCWACLRRADDSFKKEFCRKGHKLEEVGKTKTGSCQKCEDNRRERERELDRLRKSPHYHLHLPGLRKVKEESGKTWEEIWLGVGKPENVQAQCLRYYFQFRTNGEPKSRCPKRLALKLARYFGVTLKELTG